MNHDASNDRGGVHEPRFLLEDALSGLQGPRLVRAGALALSPQRVLMGTAAVVLLAALGQLNLLWPGEQRPFAQGLGDIGSIITLAPQRGPGETLTSLALVPRTLVGAFPVSTFVLGIPMLVVWAIFGGAVSRSAALEVSLRRSKPWPAMLAYGLRYARSAAGAVAIPLLLIGLGYLILAGAGWAMLSLPVLNWLGAALLSLALLLGLGVCVLALIVTIGGAMLIPSVAAEGSDAFDAIQRVLAYVTQRPLTTVLYGLIAGLSAALGTVVVFAVVDATAGWTLAASTEWLSPSAADRLTGPEVNTAAQITDIVLAIPAVLAAGYVFSAVHCAGTVWYLVCRRACDRQDVSELWDPEP